METYDYTICRNTSMEKTFHGCHFWGGRYPNGNLALTIRDSEGDIAVCTVNPKEQIDPTSICVKNYSENAGMVKTLVGLGIVHPTPNCYTRFGWIDVPVMQLTDKGRELFEKGEEE